MVQRGERLRFAREAGEAFRDQRKELGQDLDRDVAIELRIARAIDLAHAAPTELADHFISAQAGARSQRHMTGALRFNDMEWPNYTCGEDGGR